MQILETALNGLFLLAPRVFGDDRGFFFESYNEILAAKIGIFTHWAQDNHAMSVQHVLRGLHFQRGVGQAKLVRCVAGTIWDVAVDIRPSSPTLGQWYGVELSAENKKMLLIQEGFAHGYVVLSEKAEVVYKCSRVYDAQSEDEIRWNDPDIGVAWPVAEPHISERDTKAQSFKHYLESMRRNG
ncbi:MAG TPA: dTDP-4-dehydrorhamnose 3,5-epimerase [Candidatus Sumerlaeota bacterium]|nr:dTDP-4-dehydrorhamnose 3,5-epimerase [Candidatus Sumerlaeota bacterium]HPS00044.1 dTDP-4-dehydrorhamnose 3,5-epimerase [Candidatus Sumerlaeota bacterium]